MSYNILTITDKFGAIFCEKPASNHKLVPFGPWDLLGFKFL